MNERKVILLDVNIQGKNGCYFLNIFSIVVRIFYNVLSKTR